jgi:hypothetical protein
MSWANDQGYYAYPPDDSSPRVVHGKWQTKNGEIIKVSDMTDTHLYHAYKKFGDTQLLGEMVMRIFAERIKVKL